MEAILTSLRKLCLCQWMNAVIRSSASQDWIMPENVAVVIHGWTQRLLTIAFVLLSLFWAYLTKQRMSIPSEC